MPDYSIKGIYEMYYRNMIQAVVVSTTNVIDPLRYDYYLLSVSDNSIKKINSPILLAKDSQYRIHRLDSEETAFKHYASRFTSLHSPSIKAQRKLQLREPKMNVPKLSKGNPYRNRT